MKKLLKLLVFLFVMYIFIQLGFRFFSKGHNIEYKIDNGKEFLIKEKKVQNTKNEIDNYYFEITVDDTTFGIQTHQKLKNMEKVIVDIKYYEDDRYKCILPVAKNETLFTDILCKQGEFYYWYNSIKGHNMQLDAFASSISFYNPSNFENSNETIKSDANVVAYDNFPEDLYVGLEYYKGVYSFNNRSGYKKQSLFDKDIYTKDISGYVKKYYVVADYNQEYEFHNFLVVNLETNEITKITSNNAISMYSYVQGVVDNSMYIIDTANKKQYEINVKTKTAVEVGNESNGIKQYENGNWTNINIYEAINSKRVFNKYSIDPTFNGRTYARVDKVGNELSGYYYLYENVNNIYRVYRANIQNPNLINYIFETNNIDNIVYNKGNVYYKENSYIKYYSDLTGSRNLIKYDEVSFNNSLKFGTYER